MKIIRRVAIVLVVAFALFYLIARPHEAANAVHGAFAAVWGAGQAVFNFFATLASGS